MTRATSSHRVSRRLVAVRLLSALLLAGTLHACHWGTRPATLAPANGPDGARVAMRIGGLGTEQRGELYVADTLRLIVRLDAARSGTADRLVRVRWGQLQALRVEKFGRTAGVEPGEPVTAAKREQLALVSRFPQGLAAPMLERVLALVGQRALRELP